MALSSPHFRSRTSPARNRRKSDLTPILIPRLSEWQAAIQRDPELVARLIRGKRVVWMLCYGVGFGSGLLTASLVRSVAGSFASAPPARKATSARPVPVKKAAPAKRVAAPAEAPVVTIREVRR